MAMPVSVRAGDNPMGGNRFAGAYVSSGRILPQAIQDAAERAAVTASSAALSFCTILGT